MEEVISKAQINKKIMIKIIDLLSEVVSCLDGSGMEDATNESIIEVNQKIHSLFSSLTSLNESDLPGDIQYKILAQDLLNCITGPLAHSLETIRFIREGANEHLDACYVEALVAKRKGANKWMK